jgi:hypothetical protein
MKIAILCCAFLLTCPYAQFASAACSCGPTYCTDTPGYATELSKKKEATKATGAPDRLVTLYDKLDRCQAAITTSPDGFSILHQKADGTIMIDTWSAENEKNDATAVAAHTMKACYVIVSRKAFACCGAKPAEQRADYDKGLELNTSAALKCIR